KMFNAESNTHINCYTNKTYYYINVGSGFGKRISAFVQPTAAANQQINTFHDYKFHEKDEYNLAFLGRRWFGDRFDIENTKTFTFNMPDLVTTQPVNLKVYVAAVSPVVSTMELIVNGNSVTGINMPANSDRVLATQGSYIGDVNVNTNEIEVTLNYNNQGNPSAVAYVDYISVEAERLLNFNGKQFQFTNKNVAIASGIGQYNISNASDVSEVWDVSDIYNVTNFVPTEPANNLTFKANLGEAKTYVAVTSKDYFTPSYDRNTTVVNQNIKGTIFNDANGNFKDIDYLIVAPANMVSQAERLAEINRGQYNLNVKVLSLEQIYTEFSTGNQDVGAIRNVVKYIYDNASAPANRIKYLCLLGDASFDYKDRINNNTNIVPSWYSYNSFSLTDSFVSDDFYGMMDDTEGNMNTSNKLDIAVGRILAKTPQQAKEMVDKVASYYTKESFGAWRNNFVLVSDDVDKDWEGILQETTDEIGNLVSNEKSFINSVKIHTDAYQQESSAGGDRYPQVNTAFVNAVDNGALVVNYFGHGGEDG
ncbi:type IX secretion system sortase PorU, partial [Seonamhaeicola marinus]